MNKKFLVVVLIISIAINLVAVFTLGYYLREMHSHKRGFVPDWIGKGNDWHKSHLKQKLDLTKEQIEALNKKQEEMRLKILPFRKELFSKRKELMELLKEPEPNKTRADSLFKEIAILQIELETHVFENLWQMRSILTPEQREKLETLMHGLFEGGRPPEPPPMPPLPEHRP